jgi:CRISPR-associated protein Cas1
MKESFYIFQSGRLKREDNTVSFEPCSTDGEPLPKRFLPIERIESLYLFGEIDLNTRVINFLSQNNIPVHIFNYYGFYSGSYYPREYLNSGFLLVEQVNHYSSSKKRLFLAKEIISTASANILKNLKYYDSRNKALEEIISQIERFQSSISSTSEIPELMGLEGNIRQAYYQGWSEIISDSAFQLKNRVKRPPDTPINALISFVNGLIYSLCLNEIYRTQLNPLISFLHEPGERRFSLSLDLAEVFKPILGDRLIFKLINKGQLKDNLFIKELNSCYLNENGRKLVVKEFEEKLKTVITHPKLDKKVSYRRLVRIECYKLQKHILGEDEYEGLKMWW